MALETEHCWGLPKESLQGQRKASYSELEVPVMAEQSAMTMALPKARVQALLREHLTARETEQG